MNDYLQKKAAIDYSNLSRSTIEKYLKYSLNTRNLTLFSSPEEIIERGRSLYRRKLKYTDGIPREDEEGRTMTDHWLFSRVWLDRLKQKVAHSPTSHSTVKREKVGLHYTDTMVGDRGKDEKYTANPIEKDDGIPREESDTIPQDSNPTDTIPREVISEVNEINIRGKRFTREHLEMVIDWLEEEKETKKTILELQNQVNVLINQVQRLLLKEPAIKEEVKEAYKNQENEAA